MARFDSEYSKKYYQLHRDNILLKMKKYYQDNKEHIKIRSRKYYETNKESISLKAKKYHLDHKEHRKEIRKKYYWANREKTLKRNKEYNLIHKDQRIKQQQARRYKVRARVFAHYGGNPPKCACCGETTLEFLALDHIAGGGSKHRKTLKGTHIYDWIEANNYPEGFRILCHNCNLSFGYYGYCPHRKLKSSRPGSLRKPNR